MSPTKQQRDPMLETPNKREVFDALSNFTRTKQFELRVRQLFRQFMVEHEATDDQPDRLRDR